MSDKSYIDPNQDNLDNFVGKEDDQSSITGNQPNLHSLSRTQAANLNVTSEHHRSPAVSSEDLSHKRKLESTNADSVKIARPFFGTKQQQEIHFDITVTPSNTVESGIPSSLPTSVIRHTRDEPLHISIPLVNINTTPELINEAQDNAQVGSSFNIRDSVQDAGPSHFICDVCHKCFFFKSQFDRHYAIHSEVKPFSCHICEQKFADKYNLKRHIQIHSGQKNYECDQCHKVLTRKDNLVRHYRIHTGEKPCMCQKCGKSFSDPSSFNRHRKSCRFSSKAD
ncbi:unnamed protein product [Larinioides sclopetarius]|uniref:C2H2-type domain-containing protein n=1 Tax=Larinioides sclopetarius TaxID=280406 RepID=A0AAV2AQ55_9ARAC